VLAPPPLARFIAHPRCPPLSMGLTRWTRKPQPPWRRQAVIKSGASPTKKPSIESFDISSVKVKRHYLTTSTAAMKRY